jgi:kynureninase
VLVCDSVTVNLFKLAGAVLDAERGPLVGLADDFPTDRYVLEGLAASTASSCGSSPARSCRPPRATPG